MQIIRSALIAVCLTSPVTVTSSTAVAKPANSPSPKLAQTPPMGWNSWNKFACNVSEQLIRDTADAMVSTGMQSAGYQYVNIDDCWQVSRDAQGNIVADATRFPSGIKALAGYVHRKGDRKSTRLNSSHLVISYAVFCLKKKNKK